MKFIGREKEKSILKSCYNSDMSEFVAVYGRRRVGKTYLIKELFDDEFVFYATGILNGTRDAQLLSWNKACLRFGGIEHPAVSNWMDAFENLNLIVERSDLKRKVIFLDEIPWMATMNSDFLAGLDYFWNRWASSRKDILLIICGSAASWMTNKIINNKGGLHNRLTRQILIKPFTLNECEQFFIERKIPMTRFQMAEAYMVFGGIPYYLSLMKPQYSLYQNIDEMYFAEGAELSNEFDNLYKSLFRNSENYIRVVEALAQKNAGLSRAEIAAYSKLANGGRLTQILNDLSISGFLREYKAYGRKKKDSLYQLTDFFSIFDIRFRKIRDMYASDFWLKFSSTPAHFSWRGFAFERLCLLHLPQIQKALGISGVLTFVFSWRGATDGTGAQIDLVIDRNDNMINLCEMKFSSGLFLIDKKYHESLRNKRTTFTNSTHTRKAVQTTLVTTFGLERNEYSSEIVSEVALDDLFGE